MECYDCEVEMTAIKPGLNADEPIYDMIKDQDLISSNLLEDLMNLCDVIDQDHRISLDHQILPIVLVVNVIGAVRI